MLEKPAACHWFTWPCKRNLRALVSWPCTPSIAVQIDTRTRAPAANAWCAKVHVSHTVCGQKLHGDGRKPSSAHAMAACASRVIIFLNNITYPRTSPCCPPSRQPWQPWQPCPWCNGGNAMVAASRLACVKLTRPHTGAYVHAHTYTRTPAPDAPAPTACLVHILRARTLRCAQRLIVVTACLRTRVFHYACAAFNRVACLPTHVFHGPRHNMEKL